MITFERVWYKNFLSIGETGMEYNLNTKKKTLIYGKNGSGKSTILDAINFALYGKSYRQINKPQLSNHINKKDCLVELDLTTNGKKYKITRGINPNVFTVHCNGVLLDKQTSTDELQAWLEQNVIKMNNKTFKQVSVLGAADYTPFMKLTAQQRREVSDQLLDVGVFSVMSKILKDKMTLLEAKLAKQKTIKDVSESNLRKITAMIAESVTDKETETAQLKEQGRTLVAEKTRLNDILATMPKIDTQSLVERRSNLLSEVARAQSMVDFSKKKIAFFDNSKCPSCEQDITHDHKHQMQQKIEDDIERARTTLQTKQVELQDVSAKIKEAAESNELRSVHEKDLIRLLTQISACKEKIIKLTHEIDNIKASDGTLSSEHIDDAKKQIARAEEKLSKLYDDKAVIDNSLKLLKDKAIKATVIKQYIPTINTAINKYLQEFEFFIKFEFDENFDETIGGGAIKEYSYNSFSMGQRQRVDLSMLFAWRDIARLRAKADTNILFFDEILDSSLDGEGADSLLNLLDKLLGNTSVFIISHREAFVDKMESNIKIDKINGFSHIVS